MKNKILILIFLVFALVQFVNAETFYNNFNLTNYGYNQGTAIGVFNNQLWVGTDYNPTTENVSIFRSGDGVSWSKIQDFDNMNGDSVWDILAFNNSLFIATGQNQNGAGGGNGLWKINTDNNSFSAISTNENLYSDLEIFNNTLYVGASTTTGRVYVINGSSSIDDGSNGIFTLGYGRTIALKNYNNSLYVLLTDPNYVCGAVQGCRIMLYRSNPSRIFTHVINISSSAWTYSTLLRNSAGLESFKGKLYIGTGSNETGNASIYMANNGTDFSFITNLSASFITYMFNSSNDTSDIMYVLTASPNRMYKTSDGNNFQLVENYGRQISWKGIKFNNNNYWVTKNDTEGWIISDYSTPVLLTTPTQLSPPNNTNTVNKTIQLYCNGTNMVNNELLNYSFYADTNTIPTTLIQQGKNTYANITLSNQGTYYWNCRADNGTSTSNYTTARTINVSNLLFNGFTLFTTPVFEKSLNKFILNLSYISSRTSNISVTITYNNTKYNVTGLIEGANRISYTKELTTPNVSATTTKDFIFNITITETDNTITVNDTYRGTQTIMPMGIYNCTTGNITLNGVVWDEDYLNNRLNSTLGIEVKFWVNDPTTFETFNQEIINTNNFSICLTDTSQNISANVYITHEYPGTFLHRYYLFNTTFTNITKMINLYNFNTTTGISNLRVTARRQSTYGYYPGVVTTLQRKYMDTGLWKDVQMGETGDFGLVTFDIKEETTNYRLIFRDTSNNILKQTDDLIFSCTNAICELTALMSPFSPSTTPVEFQYSYVYNNNTGDITVTWSDTTNQVDFVRIEVSKYTATGTNYICNITIPGSSGSYVCDVSSFTGSVFLEVYSTASPETPQISTWITLQRALLSQHLSDSEQAFWTAGIMVTIIGAGIVVNPIFAMVFAIVGLIFVYVMGMFTALSVAGIIIAVMMVLVAILVSKGK